MGRVGGLVPAGHCQDCGDPLPPPVRGQGRRRIRCDQSTKRRSVCSWCLRGFDSIHRCSANWQCSIECRTKVQDVRKGRLLGLIAQQPSARTHPCACGCGRLTLGLYRRECKPTLPELPLCLCGCGKRTKAATGYVEGTAGKPGHSPTCRRGHPWADQTPVFDGRRRTCRVCFDATVRRYQDRVAAAKTPKLCACGCGEEVRHRGRYVTGHRPLPQPVPRPHRYEGDPCACGCGLPTRTESGYRPGHNPRCSQGHLYRVEGRTPGGQCRECARRRKAEATHRQKERWRTKAAALDGVMADLDVPPLRTSLRVKAAAWDALMDQPSALG